MIVKPKESERESRLHAAVGGAIETGRVVKQGAVKVRRGAQGVAAYWLFGMMGFGLLMSGTPLWFKAILFGIGYLLWQGAKKLRERQGD